MHADGIKRRRSVSPNGNNEYEEISTLKQRREEAKRQGYKSQDKEHQQIVSGAFSSRRDASGSKNPSHDSSIGIGMLRAEATSPIPHSLGSKEEKNHLLKSERHFQTETGIVEGNSNVAFGHHHGASAGQLWNSGGHKRPRKENLAKSKDPNNFHGLEEKRASARSGHKEDKYIAPSPSKGSHPSHFDVNHPDFKGTFGNKYRKVDKSRD